ncbi:alpha/beta fold hydrolase [Streptomyces sp. NPDC004830]
MRRAAHGRDGRDIVFDTWGDPSGHPVFLLHGTPGSRNGPRPRSSVLRWLGIHLISYDRPGYGDSPRLPRRVVAHAAHDVADIADCLGLAEFSVVGRSGGAPHALACAALLPDRVRSAAVLVSLAPPDAHGLDWFSGMAAANVRDYRNTRDIRRELIATLVDQAQEVRADPHALLSALDEEMSDTDRAVVADAGIRHMLQRNFQTAIQSSANGWIDDVQSFRKPWGFEPCHNAVPTLLWHGEHDVLSPPDHFMWLADQIPGVTAILQPTAAHFAAVPVLPEVLGWLREQAQAHSAAITKT